MRRALPRDAFLESVTVDDAGVRLRGIAPNAREVLGELEASEEFESAREVERPQPVGDGSQREVFDVRVAIRPVPAGAQRRTGCPLADGPCWAFWSFWASRSRSIAVA